MRLLFVNYLSSVNDVIKNQPNLVDSFRRIKIDFEDWFPADSIDATVADWSCQLIQSDRRNLSDQVNYPWFCVDILRIVQIHV